MQHGATPVLMTGLTCPDSEGMGLLDNREHTEHVQQTMLEPNSLAHRKKTMLIRNNPITFISEIRSFRSALFYRYPKHFL